MIFFPQIEISDSTNVNVDSPTNQQSSSAGTYNRNLDNQLKARRKVAKMLIAVVTMFAINFFPVHFIPIFQVSLLNCKKGCETFLVVLYYVTVLNLKLYFK